MDGSDERPSVEELATLTRDILDVTGYEQENELNSFRFAANHVMTVEHRPSKPVHA